MGRDLATGDEYSAPNALAIAWGKACPSLQGLVAGKGRYQLRELAVIYKGPGHWLAKVKALDTQDACPVILFASAETYLEALTRANHFVGRSAWRPDQYPGQNWAR